MAPKTDAPAAELFDYLKNELSLAQHNTDHPWRLPVLITSNKGRVVVLRGINTQEGFCYFYTDRRSAKLSQLAKSNGRASITFYQAKHHSQVRMEGTILEGSGKEKSVHWNELRLNQKSSYATDLPPGAELTRPGNGLSKNWMNKTPSSTELTDAFKNFAVLKFKIETIELLLINRRETCRCLWKSWNAEDYSWLVP